MAYKSTKETKKLVGGLISRRAIVILIIIFFVIIFYPTIKRMTTRYEAMVVEKVDGSLDYATKKGQLKHADYKMVTLCDTKGREFEVYLPNEESDRLTEGDLVKKDYGETKPARVGDLPSVEQLKAICKVRPPKPKPAPVSDGGVTMSADGGK